MNCRERGHLPRMTALKLVLSQGAVHPVKAQAHADASR